MRDLLALVCVFALCATVAPSSCKASYKVVTIPEVLEADTSYLFAISENRWVCGGFQFSYFEDEKWVSGQTTFVWHPVHGYREIPEIPGKGHPVAINEKGQLTGMYQSENVTRAYFWDPKKGFHDLGDFGSHILPNAINNKGWIVGVSTTGKKTTLKHQGQSSEGSSERFAFIWKNGELTNLGVLSGPEGIPGSYSEAMAINDEGWIVGVSNCGLAGGRFGNKASNYELVAWTPSLEIRRISLPKLSGNTLPDRIFTSDGWILLPAKGLLYNVYHNLYQSLDTPAAGTGSISGMGSPDIFYNSKQTLSKTSDFHPKQVPFPKDEYWNGYGQVRAMNSKGDIVGEATYNGASHAIILLAE